MLIIFKGNDYDKTLFFLLLKKKKKELYWAVKGRRVGNTSRVKSEV